MLTAIPARRLITRMNAHRNESRSGPPASGFLGMLLLWQLRQQPETRPWRSAGHASVETDHPVSARVLRRARIDNLVKLLTRWPFPKSLQF